MKPYIVLRFILLAALLASPIVAAPEPKGLGDPGKLQSIKIETGRTAEGRFVLTGPDAAQQKERQKAPPTERALDRRAEQPEVGHVDRQVAPAAVQKQQRLPVALSAIVNARGTDAGR